MKLNTDQVTILYNNPYNKEEIKEARKEFHELRVHIDGVGLEDYLSKIEGLENREQLELRKKHAISNKATYSKILQPKNQIFSAPGSNTTIDIPDNLKNQYWEKVDTIKDGHSLKNYLDQMWLHRVDVDPNGLLLFEKTKDGKDIYPTYKSIDCIRDIFIERGGIKYIIFEPYKEVINDKILTKMRVYDDEGDKTYLVKDDQTLLLLEDETFPNTLGYVPAIINSTRYHPNYNIRRSYVDESMELARAAVVDYSVHTIYKFLHGYPIFWKYAEACPRCDDGYIQVEGELDTKCPVCNGSGLKLSKDVSDIISLPIPTGDDPTLAPDIAGYVQPDIATWQQQNAEKELMDRALEFACWGTNTVGNNEDETATARYLDIQPVNNKLNKYSDNAEIVYTFCLKVIGNFYFPNSFKSAHVSLGRRFVIESPDILFKKYSDAREQGNSDIVLNYQYREYLQAEHSNDPEMLEVQLKLSNVQPFIHNTIQEVKEFEIDKADYFAKAYFNSWLSTLTNEYILKTDESKLRDELYIYVQPKIEKNGKEVQGDSGNTGQE